MRLSSRRLLAVSLLFGGCASSLGPAAPQHPPPTAQAASASTPTPPPAASLGVRRGSTAREDARGVLGGPRDDTAFEYDVADIEDAVEPVLEGIPPTSRFVASRVQPFLETRRAKLATLVPNAGGVLVVTRLSETPHVHRVSSPLGMREQLTFGRESVEQAAFSPLGHLTYRTDAVGSEDFQIWDLDLKSRVVRQLSDGQSRHGGFRWLSDGSLVFTSNRRNGSDMDLYLFAAGAPRGAKPRLVAELPGQWVIQATSRDGRRLLLLEYQAIDTSTLHLLDLTTGERRPVRELEPGVAISSGLFSAGADQLLVLSDRDSEFSAIFSVDLRTGSWQRVTPELRWNVEEFALSPDGKLLAYVVNEAGYSSLWLRRLPSKVARRASAIPRGVISGLRFADARSLAFNLTTPTSPMDAFTYGVHSGRLSAWTRSEVGGIASARLIAPTLVQTLASDGERLPALYYRPRGKGPFPVLLWIHGGPEGQARPMFDPIIQYFAASRQVAVLAPNIRGSDGYGKRFLALDNAKLRHNAIGDVGAWLDWIPKQRGLDPERVGIHGASYGGFVVLASLVKYGSRIRAGCDVVGPSNLVSFLEDTSDYRRDLRRREYGDESDPAMRAYLEELSPLSQASQIQSALLVAHGENDPRVPLSEARQLVSARAEQETWFFLGKSEGHTFRRQRTRDTFYRVMAEFFERNLVRATEAQEAAAREGEEPAGDPPDGGDALNDASAADNPANDAP